jgi:hypothetical protein
MNVTTICWLPIATVGAAGVLGAVRGMTDEDAVEVLLLPAALVA